jgi:arsenical pump membrane protein
MNGVLNSPVPVWTIAAVTTLGVITRPFRWPEAIWAVLGALTLCVSGRVAWSEALHAVGRGTDVYLFLTGMMLAAELARREGLFDYLAALAARQASGSATRLFFLLYAVGTVVTALMSNDATAVVLTPAVLAVMRAVEAERPLPYLYICAFVANAASFVLPISNPANLVIYREHMPTLATWLARFALPSAVSVAITYAALRWLLRASLAQRITHPSQAPRLTAAGKTAGGGIAMMAAIMLGASALGVPLGWPTFAAGLAAFVAVCLQKRHVPWDYLTEMAWAVLPLVAGLFVLVEGLRQTGVIDAFARNLGTLSEHSVSQAGWLSGITVAFASNLINNLPAGLIAGSAIVTAHAPLPVASAVLVGVDLGPNLSITGSLATLLWLTALRREGVELRGVEFLKLGIATMLPALLAALAALMLTGGF